jgi:dihydrodipicolinate synthase/N-acetylneuraminate lyase
MSIQVLSEPIRQSLNKGCVIPAHPLALDARRRLDERRQRALSRYYVAAGAGGLAVGVHTTQFEIRDPKFGLLEPVLRLAMDVMIDEAGPDFIRIAGICGDTTQAVLEARLAHELGYHAGLLSLAALRENTDDQLINHCRRVADVMPVIGFYLQPSVGGRILSYDFWRQFVEIANVVAIKIAPFNRYQTIDVIRALQESGNPHQIALYTGNDDTIITDLITEFSFSQHVAPARIVGGLLGHWAVWTKRAVEHLKMCQDTACEISTIPGSLMTLAGQVTDCNAAFFDPSHAFSGCIAGINEVLRRQGLLEGNWCLNPDEKLSPGQSGEIDRVCRTYPHLNDDGFVAEHLDSWMSE